MKLGKIVLAAGTRKPATSTGNGTASGSKTRRACVLLLKAVGVYLLLLAAALLGRLLLERLP